MIKDNKNLIDNESTVWIGDIHKTNKYGKYQGQIH